MEVKLLGIVPGLLRALRLMGFQRGRLFRLVQNRSYVFSDAYWVTPAWSDHILHPDVATVMRGAIRLSPYA